MEKWGIIEPSEIVLVTRFDSRRNKTTGTFDQVVVTVQNCTEVACEMPVFCKIKTIAVKDENVLLCGTLMETVCFDDHYHAFTVRLHPDRVLKVVNINELCSFKPFDL